MDLSRLAEPFPAEDIEWRVQACGVKESRERKERRFWARVLAYVTARAIMSRLDEVVGPENWKTEYTHIGNSKGVVCRLSIYCQLEDGSYEWVTKEDGAEETDIESFKGGISSALKRAGAAWGIGRYLYRLETDFAKASGPNHYSKKGRTKDGENFTWEPPKLPEWALPEGEAKRDKLYSDAEKAAYETDCYDRGERPQYDDGPVTQAQLRKSQVLRKALGVSDDAWHAELKRSYGVEGAGGLRKSQASELIDRLEKRKAERAENEVKETFGEGGSVHQKRQAALGLIAKVRQLGEKDVKGNPLDYSSLKVRDLHELADIVEKMEEEKELDKVIEGLDSLIVSMVP